jgi:nicotinate dehydrogenase subunit A
MPSYRLRVNGKTVLVESWDPDQPLLYILRNSLGLHATKFGCGLGQCGACTVLVDGKAARSCLLPVKQTAGRNIMTLEALAVHGRPDAIQTAFINEQAAQCGYCTSGMIMAATGFLSEKRHPTLDEAKQGMSGNLCRCGTYTRIANAVMKVSK